MITRIRKHEFNSIIRYEHVNDMEHIVANVIRNIKNRDERDAITWSFESQWININHECENIEKPIWEICGVTNIYDRIGR